MHREEDNLKMNFVDSPQAGDDDAAPIGNASVTLNDSLALEDMSIIKGKKSDIFKGRKYFFGLGRRKSSIAKVRIYAEGKGHMYVNNREYRQYFPHFEFQKIITHSLDVAKQRASFDVSIVTSGGGMRGQVESIRLGIARALVIADPELRFVLKQAGLLTRDPRVKERKKPGLKGARKAPQWAKR
ncbi:MAG: 30S ribosomal protein S9 [Parcubacteria group bacterium GW2011_GWA2_44_12]|nr:MAG: 30S ribosomal protein S9 [Parcubacteria group bacterium GW2011_GWA2_44_12]